MNNKQNDLVRRAMEKIKRDEKCKPIYYGIIGATGPTGPVGPTGATGTAGGVLNYADFYALMPPDNPADVETGTDVNFPQNGSNSGSGITRTGPSTFNLAEVGTYWFFSR